MHFMTVFVFYAFHILFLPFRKQSLDFFCLDFTQKSVLGLSVLLKTYIFTKLNITPESDDLQNVNCVKLRCNGNRYFLQYCDWHLSETDFQKEKKMFWFYPLVVVWMEADLNVNLQSVVRKGMFEWTKCLEKSVASPEDQVLITFYKVKKHLQNKTYAWAYFHFMLTLNIRGKMLSQGTRFQFRSSFIVRHQQFLILDPWFLRSQSALFWRRACSAPVVKSEETPALIG